MILPNPWRIAAADVQNLKRSDNMAIRTKLDRQSGYLAEEGDTNRSPRRQDFREQHLAAETRAMLAEDDRFFVHQSLSTPCLNVLDAAQGSCLIDHQGRQILDFHGNSVHQVGHGHPQVLQAVKEQLDELAFCPRRYTNARTIELARRLSEMAPVRDGGDVPRILFAPAGATANGIAMKMVRLATGRFKTISMWGAFSRGFVGHDLHRRGSDVSIQGRSAASRLPARARL